MPGTNKRIFRAKARAGHWGLGVTGSGKDQVAVLFDISTEGADVKDITWYGYFTEATFERTIEALRHCGWEGDDLSNLQGLDAHEVDLVIEDEEYNGSIAPKVQFVNRPGGLALSAPMGVEKTKAFAASMRDRIRAIDASKGVRKAAATPATAPKPAPRPAPQRAGPPEPPPHTDADSFDVPF